MKLPLSLLALAIAAFGIGTTEFVIMGLLPAVSKDLNVSIPSAGLLIGGYALGVTFGSPIMATLLSRYSRKSALLLLLGIFIVGNGLCAVAPTYGLLMAARILTALCHGTFFGIGAVVATQLVEPRHRSRAVSIMFSGLTLANILGVPFGTALGQGLGWRAGFAAIVPIGIVAVVAVWRWVPQVANQPGQSFAREVRAVANPAVILPMLTSILVSACLFCTFTYVAPLLEQTSGISPRGVTLALLLFGVATTVGNLVGGRLADWRQVTGLIMTTAGLVMIMLILAQVVVSPIGAIAGIAAWGFIIFACCAPLQTRVVDGAKGAPNLASVLNQSAFNCGNAIGAWLGGQALLSGLSYAQLPLLSAVIAALALGTVLCDAAYSRRSAARLVAAE